MTVISLTIPDELESALQALSLPVETFILNAIRNELAPLRWASDVDIEVSAANDVEADFLNQQEIAYYMGLPNV